MTDIAGLDSAALRRSDDSGSRWVCFQLAEQCFGLEILKVHEVLSNAEIEPVPGAPNGVLGVCNLRGSIVTVLDLRIRMGLGPQAGIEPDCVIVVDGPGERVGLRVDRVVDVRSVRTAAIRPILSSAKCDACVIGAVVREGQVLSLLNTDVLTASLAPAAHAGA